MYLQFSHVQIGNDKTILFEIEIFESFSPRIKESDRSFDRISF